MKLITAFSLLISLGGISVHADNEIWTGAGGDTLFSNGSNWSGGNPPGALTGGSDGGSTSEGLTSDEASFNDVLTYNIVDIDQAGQSIGGVAFYGNTGSYTIGSAGANAGNPLYLYNAIIDVGPLGTLNGVNTSVPMTNASEVTETINAPLVIENSGGGYSRADFYNVSNSGTGTGSAVLDIAGNVSGTSYGNYNIVTLGLEGSNTNANTVSGLISNGPGGNDGGTVLTILANGSGTWNLTNNNNTFTGQVDIFNGVLAASSIANEGVASALGKGGSHTADSNEVSNPNNNYTIVLGQNSSTVSGTLEYTGGTASSNRPFLINNGSNGGNGIIQVATAGQTLTLSGGISSETSDASNLTLEGPGNGVLSGGISNADGLGLSVNSGKWTLSGANGFTMGGAIVVSNSGSVLAVNAALNAAAVVAGNGTTLMGNGNITGAVGVNTGATLQVGADDVTTGTSLTLNSGVTLNTGSTLAFVLGAGHTSTVLALDSGSTNSFADGLSISLLGSDYSTGEYSDIITGLGSDPDTEGTWLITTPGDTGSFTYSDGDISLDLTAVAAAPEPGTSGMLLLGAGSFLALRTLRRRGSKQ